MTTTLFIKPSSITLCRSYTQNRKTLSRFWLIFSSFSCCSRLILSLFSRPTALARGNYDWGATDETNSFFISPTAHDLLLWILCAEQKGNPGIRKFALHRFGPRKWRENDGFLIAFWFSNLHFITQGTRTCILIPAFELKRRVYYLFVFNSQWLYWARNTIMCNLHISKMYIYIQIIIRI